MKQAQCDQAKWNKAINHGLTIQAITIDSDHNAHSHME